MSDDLTTHHVRKASSGDDRSLAWVIERFTPFLVESARFRLGKRLQNLHDPEDVVSELWVATLPRLADLDPREGRMTPVLLRFLSTALVHRINNIARKHIIGAARATGESDDAPGDDGDHEARVTGVITGLARRERATLVRDAMEELAELDREILVLRGFEQNSNIEVAELLGIEPGAAATRYHRALGRLRDRLPGSILDDLEA